MCVRYFFHISFYTLIIAFRFLYRSHFVLPIICEEYASKLRTFFPCSKIIRRSSNGGCTYAYNDGIKVALADKNVDAILLIGNDIRLPAGELTKLYHFLYRDEGLGMVAPVVLKKDSEVIFVFERTLCRFSL